MRKKDFHQQPLGAKPPVKLRIDNLLTFDPITTSQEAVYKAWDEGNHIVMCGTALPIHFWLLGAKGSFTQDRPYTLIIPTWSFLCAWHQRQMICGLRPWNCARILLYGCAARSSQSQYPLWGHRVFRLKRRM